MLNLFIPGNPAPQGSKRHVGKGVMIEASKRVKPWREDIRAAAISARKTTSIMYPSGTPVIVRLSFYLQRPKGAKKSAFYSVKRPDLDKLCRAVLDALTSAGVWQDDSQVVVLEANKRLAETGTATGLLISVARA